MGLKTLPGAEQTDVVLVTPARLPGRVGFGVTSCSSFLYTLWLQIFWLETSVKARKILVLLGRSRDGSLCWFSA